MEGKRCENIGLKPGPLGQWHTASATATATATATAKFWNDRAMFTSFFRCAADRQICLDCTINVRQTGSFVQVGASSHVLGTPEYGSALSGRPAYKPEGVLCETRTWIALLSSHAAQVTAHGPPHMWPICTWKVAARKAQPCSQDLLYGTMTKSDNHMLPGYWCSMATLVPSVHRGSFSA